MSPRLTKFRSLKEHLVIGLCFKALAKKEVDHCESFIAENEALDDNQFAEKVNRMWLNIPKDQGPTDKKRNAMWALLSQSIQVKIYKRRNV